MKFFLCVLCVSVIHLLVFSPVISAQGDGEGDGDSITIIEPDTTINLRLDGQIPTILAYVAEGGEALTLTARALGEGTIEGLDGTYTLDTVIEILSPDGERLAYNDDHHADAATLAATDSAIERLILMEAGTYLIRVNSFNGVTAGEVEVSHALVSPVDYAITTENETSLILNVALNPAQPFSYRFTVEAGTQYTIVARDLKGRLDPIITLRDTTPDETVIATNDDYAYRFGDAFILNVFDARIIDAEIPMDGDYTLEVREFLGRGGQITVQMVKR